MICLSCLVVVKSELERLKINYFSVEAGRVETKGDISEEKISQLKVALFNAGLELTDDRKNSLVDKIKNVIFEMLYSENGAFKINFSNYLSACMQLDYTYLSNTFSKVAGITIEQYIIVNKIDRVKQLINFQELNLTEISWKLHYSSVAHLSTQFKKVTGLTPSRFKQIGCSARLAA
jgi:AraC-like DNA-binding protein